MTEDGHAERELEEYRRRLRILTSKLSLAEERERRRIAGVLHDRLGHSLALAQIRLGKMEQRRAGDPRTDVRAVRDLIAQAIETTRSLTFELSSPILYELGLDAALESTVDRLAATTGLDFRFEGDGQRRPLSEDAQVLVYRCVRELLVNAAKHASARTVTLTVRTVAEEAHIRVADDGIGFDAREVMSPTGSGIGHGLLAVVHQLQSIGGSLEVRPTPGEGTVCSIVVPLDPAA